MFSSASMTKCRGNALHHPKNVPFPVVSSSLPSSHFRVYSHYRDVMTITEAKYATVLVTWMVVMWQCCVFCAVVRLAALIYVFLLLYNNIGLHCHYVNVPLFCSCWIRLNANKLASANKPVANNNNICTYRWTKRHQHKWQQTDMSSWNILC